METKTFSNLDLLHNKYSMEILKQNIYDLNLLDILKTQHLSSEFVINFILNKDFQLTEEENNITVNDVFLNQPHLINDFEIKNFNYNNINKSKIHKNKKIFNFDEYAK
jgi:hypothetical protein